MFLAGSDVGDRRDMVVIVESAAHAA